MANIFYLEKGYKISEIATYSKFFGVFATILGGFIAKFDDQMLDMSTKGKLSELKDKILE